MIIPGSVIGIIGGGQLGRMMALAASHLGYRVHIFTPEHDSPASQVAWKTTLAEYNDTNALLAFSKDVDVITFEFENISPEHLLQLEKPVFPSPSILKTTRNRITEKSFLRDLGIGTAPFAKVTSKTALDSAISTIKLPAVLKTTELGYDGKGQRILQSPVEAEKAWNHLNTDETILEGFIDFVMEISVIVARSSNKQSICYPAVHNIHKNHILDKTIAPAPIDDLLAQEAEKIAITIAESLDLRGLLAVEMFVTQDNKILVNELAPRPHNSGHWTMDGCVTSQFEQAIRAVCGLPLGSTTLKCPVIMQNLVGYAIDGWQEYLNNPNTKLYLYGKSETRTGRKMGHVNLLAQDN